jgi:hypothetical protein
MRLRLVALAVAVGLAFAVSPFASSSPDGLERVATDHGFVQRASSHAGYAAPGVGDERLAKGLAGFAGTLLVFGALSVAAARRRRA